MKFYLEQTPQLIADVGYVAAPQEDYTQGLSKLQPFLTRAEPRLAHPPTELFTRRRPPAGG